MEATQSPEKPGRRPVSMSSFPAGGAGGNGGLQHSPSSESVKSHDSAISNGSVGDEQELEERRMQRRRDRVRIVVQVFG